MLASKETQHLGRVAHGRNMPERVLQTAAIWGGNASGKSNLCRVLEYAKHLIVTGTRTDGPTGRIPFRLRENAISEPSRFEFDILVEVEGEERVYRYIFAVNSREVVEESLTEIRAMSEKEIFSRKPGEDDTSKHTFNLDWWERRGVPEEERMFAKFVARGTKPNQLFLHEAMDRNVTVLAPVFRWFRDQLVVLGPNDDYLSLRVQETEQEDLRDFTVSILNRADTGIVGIEAVDVPLTGIGMPKQIQDELRSTLKEDDAGIILRSADGARFRVFPKDGELMARRIVTYRNSKEGKKVPFETSDESDGTLRLFDLSPVFHDLATPGCRRVYVIDELDRSMHAQLTEALLEHYHGTRSKDTRTQLIFTTHNVLLMDQALLRRDEMWFIERGKHGETLLESLSDYKEVRYDKDVRKAYLKGRFSGVPHLSPFLVRRHEIPPKEALRLNEEPATYNAMVNSGAAKNDPALRLNEEPATYNAMVNSEAAKKDQTLQLNEEPATYKATRKRKK